jgi:hypothetical protein
VVDLPTRLSNVFSRETEVRLCLTEPAMECDASSEW